MFTVYLLRVVILENGDDVENHIKILIKQTYQEHPTFDPISLIGIYDAPDYGKEKLCINYLVRLVTRLPEAIVMKLLNDASFAEYQNHVKALDRLLA